MTLPLRSVIVRQVAQPRALLSYPGALIVASYDLAFLCDIGLTRWVRLDRELTEIDPL